MAGEFDLHQLLAGPIIAMNDAQADAAASFYELFDQFAFEPAEVTRDAEPAPRRLRMISFVAERAIPGGIERRQISMPLLQMIPIGGIAIDSAKIQFSLAVNAEPPASTRTLSTAPAAAERAIVLKGRIAPTVASETEAGNLQVEIMLARVHLPGGYLDMIAETQGGLSQPLAEPAAEDTGTKGDEAPPLFQATVGNAEAPTIVSEQEYEIAMVIDPNARLVGAQGLEILFGSEPRQALQILAPSAPIRLDRRLADQRVRIRVGEMVAALGERTEVALLVEGESIGPDGVNRRQVVRLVLPRNQQGPKS